MLRECDWSEVMAGCKTTPIRLFAEQSVGDFVESGAECAEVTGWDEDDMIAVYQALRDRALRSGACECHKRSGKLYLTKKGI